MDYIFTGVYLVCSMVLSILEVIITVLILRLYNAGLENKPVNRCWLMLAQAFHIPFKIRYNAIDVTISCCSVLICLKWIVKNQRKNILRGDFQLTSVFEPCHEKTCLCHMRTTKVQISLRIRAV